MQYEGETPQAPDPSHFIAIRAWRLLATGMGGFDWAGLPVVAELLGIEDPQQLIERLLVIRYYQPDKENEHGPGNPVD